MRSEQAKRLDITADRVLKEWGKIAFSNLMDYFEVQPDGSAVIDLSALTPDQAAALQEITVDEYTEGTGKAARQVKKVRIKLGDKKGALDSIAKHFGMFTNKEFDPSALTSGYHRRTPRQPAGVPGQAKMTTELTPPQRDELLAAFDDHATFCRESLQIRNITGSSVAMELSPGQVKLDAAIKNSRRGGNPCGWWC